MQSEPNSPLQFPTFFRNYLKFALGWVQVVCLLYVLLTAQGIQEWWLRFWKTWIIAQVATCTCFWVEYGLESLIAAIRKKPITTHSLAAAACRSLLLLPLGIYLGLDTQAWVGQRLGWPSEVMQVDHWLTSILLGSICISIFVTLRFFIDKQEKESKQFKHHLEEIAKILEWFDAQEELDVEQAIEKVKKASALIAASKKRLKELENEFREIKKEAEE